MNRESNRDDWSILLNDFFIRNVAKITLILIKKFDIERTFAEDLIQESFEKLISSHEDNKSSGKTRRFDEFYIFNFIMRSCVNRYIDTYRKTEIAHKNKSSIIDILSESGTNNQSIESEIDLKKDVYYLIKAVKKLKQPYRDIFSLMIYDEIPLSEIADRLNIKEGSIYVQFKRGLDLIRYNIEKMKTNNE